MANDIEKFDSSSVMNNVRDRIKATFVGLIPDEQWDAMIQAEVKGFFKNSDKWNNDRPSEFQKLTQEVIREFAKERVKEILKTFQTEIWNSNIQAHEPTEVFKKIITENASSIFAQVFTDMTVGVIQNMKNRGY